MSLQDKMREFKERREAQSYFRENNSEYLQLQDYIKVLAIGILVASMGGLAIQWVSYMTQWVFMYAFALVGYGVGIAVKKVTNTGNVKVASITVISYVVGIVFGMLLFYGFMIGLSNISNELFKAYFSIIYRDTVTLIFIFIGAICAYNVAKK